MLTINEGARPAQAADIAALAALAAAAKAEFEVLRGGSIWSRLEARPDPLADSLRGDLRSAEAHLVAGTIDDTIVGFGAVRLVGLSDGQTIGRVGDIYVTPDARGVGVGEAIMDALVEWASARGCVGVDSLALPGDRATKNFFETHGLVARSIIVYRALPASR